MSDIDDDHPTAHGADAAGHGADDAAHAQAGHAEDGEHAPTLGPIDWAAWGAGIVGVAAGLAVVLCMYLSVGGL